MTIQTRREFLRQSAVLSVGAGLSALPCLPGRLAWSAPADSEPLYKISVAEYSLHRMIAKKQLDPLDFGPFCREKFKVDGVEYWMGPFKDKGADTRYIDEMKKRSDNAGVRSLLIMIDGEGAIGDPDAKKRKQAVENHHKWVVAAKRMGCHSIRVNAQSSGSYDEQMKLAADGLAELCRFAAGHDLNIIVENHGGLSSNGKWLSGVMKRVDLPNCGTLPDFGNFKLGGGRMYDRYQGVKEMMPYAKAVSAKSHGFDADGNETGTDYHQMMKIVVDSGYRGFVGVEWEGATPGEVEGTLLTKKLLERVRSELAEARSGRDSRPLFGPASQGG